MKLTIEINMDNDAFADESTRVFRVRQVFSEFLDFHGEILERTGAVPLFDLNGNKVGAAQVEGSAQLLEKMLKETSFSEGEIK